jgi:cytochrome P450
MIPNARSHSIPHLREPFLLGSARAMQTDALAVLRQLAAECGSIGHFRLGPFPVVFVNSPALIQGVLVDQAAAFDKGPALHRAVRPVVRAGLFNSEDPLHRQQRKTLAPAFTPRQIAGYADTMTAYAESMQQTWRDGAVLDLTRELTSLTMSIAGKVLFDVDVFNETDELGAAITTALRYIIDAMFQAVPTPLSWPTARNRQTRAAIALIQHRLQAMIAERRHSADDRHDFLSILLRTRDEQGQPMADQQVQDEALTLFVAGHETTATALAWCFYLLLTHPAIYEQVQTEVDAALGGRTPTVADLPHLPYTLQVLKETLRLYPPGWLLNRRALRDVEIGGYRIRRGMLVMNSIYTLHRQPALFPDPERFDPERFRPANEKQIPRYAYVPFGAGPRICIGNHFALMEAQLILATLIARVSFRPLPDQVIEPEGQMTLRLKQGYRTAIRRR